MSDHSFYARPRVRSLVGAHARHNGWNANWPEGLPAFTRTPNIKTLGDLRREKPPSAQAQELAELDRLLDVALEEDGGDAS